MKKLTETKTAEFYKIWYGLLSYVNKNKRICSEAKTDLDELNYQTNDVSLIHPIRNYLWEHPKLIASYIKAAGDELSERECSVLTDWQKHHIKGRFVILRNIAKYTVFMRFDGIITYDTIIASYALSYGTGMVSSFEQFYSEERQKRGITESLTK